MQACQPPSVLWRIGNLCYWSLLGWISASPFWAWVCVDMWELAIKKNYPNTWREDNWVYFLLFSALYLLLALIWIRWWITMSMFSSSPLGSSPPRKWDILVWVNSAALRSNPLVIISKTSEFHMIGAQLCCEDPPQTVSQSEQCQLFCHHDRWVTRELFSGFTGSCEELQSFLEYLVDRGLQNDCLCLQYCLHSFWYSLIRVNLFWLSSAMTWSSNYPVSLFPIL